jgi:hypothetical protein
MTTIQWHCRLCGSESKAFIGSCLDHLAQWIRDEPVRIEVKFTQVNPECAEVVESLLASNTLVRECDFDAWQDGLCEQLARLNEQKYGDPSPGRILLYCPGYSALAEAVQRVEPNADWGANRGFLSMVWLRNVKQLVWHETLHLLGAEDCYDLTSPASRPKCLLEPRCLMQREPLRENCGDEPVLCRTNIALLQKCDLGRDT